jgi:hypothetical protein
MKRRRFIKTSLAAGASLMAPAPLCRLAAQSVSPAASPPVSETATPMLPWVREIPLREAASKVTVESMLNPDDPQPDYGGNPFGGRAMTINNLKMRTTLWGPPERITISLNKNDVWDRRLHEFRVPTLQDLTEGAFAPVNKDYVGIGSGSLRPKDLGWLWKEGGSHDPYREPMRYAFPSLKPVGQIILGIDPLAGAAAPRLSQNCGTGVVSLEVVREEVSAKLEYVLGMTANTYAIRGSFPGITVPVWLRLYRHQDTSHLTYMTVDGKSYTNPVAEADKAFNGPIDPPTSGQDGRYFWIRQKMPAEKTFPDGFEYVLMGVIASPGNVHVETVAGKTGLGTPPPNQPLNQEWKGAARPAIAAAPGAAATATFTPAADSKWETFVTVVTTSDGPDLLSLARERLVEAEAGGFDGMVRRNAEWWNAFYDRRENGRVFHGTTGSNCTDDIHAIYRSYADSHGGGTKTDMRRFEGSASYALPERDFQEWDSAPCYNEIFTTSRFVRNWGDSEDMWKQIVWHWLPAAKENARHMFNLPGMLISHGYLPPVKPAKYVHTTITLELCLGTMAQIVKPSWDEWDYGGDSHYLREQCYPLMKQMALFYAAYAKKGDDGYYHIVPCMQEESWGIYPAFSRNKDVISSLCMFRWGLNRAADAAEILGVDDDLRRYWREVASQLAPYPTWQRAAGPVFAEMPGLEPIRLAGDHFGDAAAYPALLADEINLDSPAEQREMIIRGVQLLPSGSTAPTLLLMGVPAGPPSHRRQAVEDAEAFLNSRGGRIHLFPAVSPTAAVAFRNFQARGGFLVSACRNAGGVYYVEIQARRDRLCQLINPWPGKPVVIRKIGNTEFVPFTLDEKNGECLVFSAAEGQRYFIEPRLT